MNRTILIVFVFLLVTGVTTAQVEEKDRFISLNTGPLIPFAEFSSSSMRYAGGFAGNGWNGKLDYFNYFGKYFGFNLNVGYSFVDFNEQKCTEAYNNALNQSEGVSLKAGNYHIFKGGVALVFKSPQVYNSEIYAKAELGSSLNFLPEIYVNDNNRMTTRIQADEAVFATAGLGMGIIHFISGKTGIIIEYSIIKSWPFTRFEPYGPANKLIMSYHNFNIGLVHRFD